MSTTSSPTGAAVDCLRKTFGRQSGTPDRGYSAFDGVQNFLTAEATRAPVIVCNPPFAIASHFAVKALSLEGVEQVAMIFPTARLNTAHWLRDTPLARVWLMTPRPSMPPGHVIATGEKPGGGKMDFCWLVWDRAYSGAPAMQWLHRAGRTPAQR
jgi:hypothetical protein